MQRLSSKMTFYYKRVFPFMWFGILALIGVFTVSAPLRRARASDSMLFSLAPLVFMAGFGYIMMKRMAFDLVDEVLDAGDALVVRNGGVEDHIALSEIINVGYTQFSNPPRATLTLRNPSRLGDKITFCPPVRLLRPLSPSPLMEDLIRRIDAARRSAR